MMTCDRRVLFGSSAAAFLPAALLCALLARPALLADAWGVPCLKGVLPEQRRREAEIDGRVAALHRRTAARQALVADLAEGRFTLLETAARFRELDRASPDFPREQFLRAGHGLSDDEHYCLQVIGHLRAYAPLGPRPTEEMALRLEKELDDLRARDELRLPEARG